MDGYSLRQAGPVDINTAMRLIDDAKAYLKGQGIDQWQAGYPDRECIREDIHRGRGYFLTGGGEACAYFCLDFSHDFPCGVLTGGIVSATSLRTGNRNTNPTRSSPDSIDSFTGAFLTA